MNDVRKTILTGFMSVLIVGICTGQITYSHALDLNFNQSFFRQDFDKNIRNQSEVNQPTILGNIDHINLLSLSYYKADYSEKFIPGITLSLMDYRFAKRLNSALSNLKMNTISIGFGLKYFLLKSRTRWSINGIADIGMGIQNLYFLESYFQVSEYDAATNTIYYTDLHIEKRNEVSLIPYLKLGLDFNYDMYDFLQIKASIYSQANSYPHYDLDAPLLFLETFAGIGVSYKIGKNKRNYYD